ncbi:tripartite tricarboxylate transporter substrate binding protein [Micromonospora sp. DR5-3]|uniref:Bug family tripartite tricarboxylate transporter substrate binding protein n=1 Tax=unclassified Micromonospora TaxID=2617518 RepID=UPI0011DB5D61|nr:MULTISPECIES: tripartite tricarboxylate transporter substrate binding protein [unclassified Micromonospora]MCW3813484.1 tripartite tricarboxylate transporter substrate binding protein [Micromonospora sp. DR5-3]TYC24849.1 tripartite tricarboxylate transporter substrate binding protein [Micromonospora sp. MP36]
MTIKRVRRWATAGAGFALALSLAACGGNVGGGGSDDAKFPGKSPITILVGQDPGGSTDLIARALADKVSNDLGVPVTVENKPGANGGLAAKELAGKKADGHTLMVYNGSLAYITPLAVAAGQAPDMADYDIVTGISQDDYVMVTAAKSGFKTVDDLAKAGRPITFGTTGVGTGSQLSQELLFRQANIPAKAVPFKGGSPTLTAVLGGQVDVGSVQLGEAIEQVKAGKLTPIVTFAEKRPTYLPDTPTAVEAGHDVPVQQSRAIFAPKGTPKEVIDALRASFQKAFQADAYKKFNEDNLLTPNEVDGEELRKQWTANLDKYRAVVQKYNIQLGEAK